jgi:hypothetical protein
MPEDRMDVREVIAARLAEWNLKLSDSELDQLVPAYQHLIRWQAALEEMLRSRKIADGMNFPESEPLTIHALDKKVQRNE